MDKKILKLTDSYQPSFYILPRNDYDGNYLFYILSQQTLVKKVSWDQNKSTNMFEEYSNKKLICVVSGSVQSYAILIKRLERDSRVKQIFNTDLSHVQQYMFHRLKIEPTSKIEVEYEDSTLVKLANVEDGDDIIPPPLSILYIDVQTLSGKINPEDPVVLIKSKYEDISDPQQAVETLFDRSQDK